MKQIKYTGQESRVLVDVGSLSTGDTFFVSDDFAAVLTSTLPDLYTEVIADTTSKKTDTVEPSDDTKTAVSKKTSTNTENQ